MKRLHGLAIVLAVMAEGSCADQRLESPAVRFAHNQITVVSPVDQPLWEVRDAVAVNGTVWVLASSAPFVRGFGPSNARLRAFGRRGQGPSDLRFPNNLWTRQSPGSVLVWDPGSARVLVFSSEGVLLSTRRAPIMASVRSDIGEVTFGHPFRALQVSSGIIVPHYDSGVNHGAELWNAQLLLLREDGTEPVVVLDFAQELPNGSKPPEARLLVPVPLWDVCEDDRIAVLDPIARTLFIFSIGDPAPNAIVLPWEPAPLASQAQLAYVESRVRAELGDQETSQDEIRRYAQETVNRAQDLFPIDEPLGVDLKCAPGRVWVQEFDGTAPPLGYGTKWRTITIDRPVAQVSRVEFPTGFAPIRFSDDGALGLLTDSLGFQRVAQITFSLGPPS